MPPECQRYLCSPSKLIGIWNWTIEPKTFPFAGVCERNVHSLFVFHRKFLSLFSCFRSFKFSPSNYPVKERHLNNSRTVFQALQKMFAYTPKFSGIIQRGHAILYRSHSGSYLYCERTGMCCDWAARVSRISFFGGLLIWNVCGDGWLFNMCAWERLKVCISCSFQ